MKNDVQNTEIYEAGKLPVVDVLGLNLCCITTNEFQKILINHIENHKELNSGKVHGSSEKIERPLKSEKSSVENKLQKPLFATYLNAHCFNVSFSDDSYRKIIKTADILYADGQAVVWASKLGGPPALPERVNAGDFITEFFRKCAEKNIKIFLLGGAQNVLDAAINHFTREVPGIKITGSHHGYISMADDKEILNKIESSGADIVIAGMGVPRQEEWAARNLAKICGNAGAVWCVGALYEYFSGLRPRAPVWMRKAGFEWLFRLFLEPGRMWKRYLIGNMFFIYRVLKWYLKKKK